MITYNNIVNRFETFVTNHLILRTFTHGSPADVDLDKFELYPLLHLVYTGSSYDAQQKTYAFEIYILDLPPDKENKTDLQKELISNAEQIAEDILADMRTGGNIFDFGHYYAVTSASTTPLEEETSNVLSGVLLDVSIQVGYEYDSCNAPLSGVTQSGSVKPTIIGGPISTIHYSSDKTTDFDAGLTTINIPEINSSEWLSGEYNLRKSISYIQSGLFQRHEIHGLNSSATISGEFVFKVEAYSSGIITINLVTSGASFTGSVEKSFLGPSTVELSIIGSTINQNAVSGFFGASIMSTLSGVLTLSSVSLTINNQF